MPRSDDLRSWFPDIYQQEHPDVLLAAITTNLSISLTSTDYILQDWQLAGLHKPSMLRCYLGTYEQDHILRVIGRISDVDWHEICKKLSVAIGAKL